MKLPAFNLLLLSLIFAVCEFAQPQETPAPALKMQETGAYSTVERTDLRRYDNGKYTGLMRREVRGTIIPGRLSSGTLAYRGNFFVLESTLRDLRHSAQALDAVFPVSFWQDEEGALIFENDRGFPKLRGFPYLPPDKKTPGSKWQAPGILAADPLNTGEPVLIPFIAEYEYRQTEEYGGRAVHRVTARYASRYEAENPEAKGIVRVQGNHSVDILIRAEDRLPVFMRDSMDETYFMAGGSKLRFAGFTLTFGTAIVPLDRGEMIASLDDKGLKKSDIDITTVSEGIRLSVKDIRFAPDSAEFLPAERARLDLIGETLRQIPNRTFLVEGHTAAIGRPAAELELSVERAKRMIDEMQRRGIAADRFIYKGWGGTKPIGDNATETGRSINRRVEITILE